MRLNELLDRYASGGAVHAPAVESLQSWVDLADVRRADGPVAAGDVVISVARPGSPEFAAELAALTAGAALIALLPGVPVDIPTGAIVAAVTAGGSSVVDAVPLTHHEFHTAVVVTRIDGIAGPGRYLAGATGAALSDAGLRRVVNEYVLDGFVSRARLGELEARALAAEQSAATVLDKTAASEAALRASIAALQAERNAVAAELAAARKANARLTDSVQMALGQALVDIRKRPFSGLATFPRKVGDARKGSTRGS